MSRFQNPSATDTGKTEDFNLQLARGHVSNHSSVHKFGWNPGVGTAFETIWDGSNVYTYHNAGVATVISTNGVDSQGTVEIQGLDENFLLQTETVTVDGSASSTQFARVFRARLLTANTGTTNTAAINVRVDNTTSALISAGAGQTLMSVYTVPANKTGYLKKIQFTSDKDGQPAVFRILTRDGSDSGPFRNSGQFGQMNGPTQYEYAVPLRFAANTDIQIQGKASASSPECGCVFDLVLVDGQDTITPGTGVL